MTKYIGLGVSIFLTLAGLGVSILGAVLPHWGVGLSGALIALISGYAVAITAKKMKQESDLSG